MVLRDSGDVGYGGQLVFSHHASAGKSPSTTYRVIAALVVDRDLGPGDPDAVADDH